MSSYNLYPVEHNTLELSSNSRKVKALIFHNFGTRSPQKALQPVGLRLFPCWVVTAYGPNLVQT